MDHSKYIHLTITPVIASFDSDGHMKPLYVRIDGSSFKIQSSFVKSCYSDILEFSCQIIDREYVKSLSLTYFPHDRVWAMQKNPAY